MLACLISYVYHHHSSSMHVRHAQGVHNVEGETDHSAYMKPDFFDARVTPLGWNQVIKLCSSLSSFTNLLPATILLSAAYRNYD